MAEHLDLIRDLSASEQGGVVVELRRLAIVSGLVETSAVALFEALNALSLEAQSELAGYQYMVLVERNPRVIDKDKAEVELVYRHYGSNEYQDLTNPPLATLVYTCDGALASKTSQVDSNGDEIKLGCIYSTNDAHYGAMTLAQRTSTQGGEVSVHIPTKTLTLTGIINGMDGDSVIDGILGHVNEALWRGGEVRTWLCTQARYTPWGTLPDDNKYTFTFEHNPDGWDQKAVFVHGATGRVISDWKTQTDGTNAAYKVVTWYPEVDFADYFNNLGAMV